MEKSGHFKLIFHWSSVSIANRSRAICFLMLEPTNVNIDWYNSHEASAHLVACLHWAICSGPTLIVVHVLDDLLQTTPVATGLAKQKPRLTITDQSPSIVHLFFSQTRNKTLTEPGPDLESPVIMPHSAFLP